MTNETSPNFHFDYMDVTQHWCPEAETFAGGDALLTMLATGWTMNPEVREETHYFSGMRQTAICHVKLERNGQTMEMPILRNPYISRMLMSGGFKVVPMEQLVRE